MFHEGGVEGVGDAEFFDAYALVFKGGEDGVEGGGFAGEDEGGGGVDGGDADLVFVAVQVGLVVVWSVLMAAMVPLVGRFA